MSRPPNVLRVMSYNVRDLLDDRAAVVRVVRAVAPDVLCLQEVPRRLTTEIRLPLLARDCGMVWGRGRLGTGGTAVLTAPEVVVGARLRGRLRVRFPRRTRGYAAVAVALPAATGAGSVSEEGEPVTAGWVTVASIHLGLDADERERHAGVVLEAVGGRAVVAGDLNESGGGAAHRRLAGSLRVVSGAVPTFPSWRPTSVLDVVLASPDLVTVAGEPVRLDPADLAAASDHLPVWVDLAAAP